MRGVTIAVKPHVGASVYNTATLVEMWRRCDSPALGANIDSCTSLEPGGCPGNGQETGQTLVHVHLREYPDVADRQNMKLTAEEEIGPAGAGVDFPPGFSKFEGRWIRRRHGPRCYVGALSSISFHQNKWDRR